MKNDHRGLVSKGCIASLFNDGTATHNGKPLPAGYYAQQQGRDFVGPFNTRWQAELAAARSGIARNWQQQMADHKAMVRA